MFLHHVSMIRYVWSNNKHQSNDLKSNIHLDYQTHNITNDSTNCRGVVGTSVQSSNWEQLVSCDSYSGMRRREQTERWHKHPDAHGKNGPSSRRVFTTHPRVVHQYQVQVRCAQRAGAYPPRCSREFAKAPSSQGARIRAYVCTAAALAQPLLRHLGINAVISSTQGNSSARCFPPRLL